MAKNTFKYDGKEYDKAKVLGAPEGADLPTAKLLAEVMADVGYTVNSRTPAKVQYETIISGPRGKIGELRKQLADRMGWAATKAAANGSKELTVAEMRERIARKWDGEVAVPRDRETVEEWYTEVVEHGRLPFHFPAGTRLQDVQNKQFTTIAVSASRLPDGTPDDPPMEVIEISAKASAGLATALANIREKANRKGQFVAFNSDPVEVDAFTWQVECQVIPADTTTS